MSKRILILCLLGILSVNNLCWADPEKANPGTAESKPFTDVAVFKTLRTGLDFIDDSMAELGLKFQDARVSPLIRSENWCEFPVEIGFLSPEGKLIPALQKVIGFSFGDSRISHWGIRIARTAEVLEGDQVLLTVVQNLKLIYGPGQSFPDSLLGQNRMISRAFTELLKVTTFNPQVRKKVEGGGVGSGKTWITNLEIDSDDRVHMTGYALDFKFLTKLAEDLLMSGSFGELSLTNINRNVYEKVPVWRFDIVAKMK